MWKSLKEKYPFPDKPTVPKYVSGWSVWKEQITGLLRDIPAPTVIEVGVWLGKTSLMILESIPDSRLIAIDHWQGSVENQPGWYAHDPVLPKLYETFIANVWEYKDRVVPIRQSSVTGLTDCKKEEIEPDLIYIDASHDYKSVLKDVTHACLLFPDAIVCGDDWHHRAIGDGPMKPRVREAVEKYCQLHGRIVIVIENFWYLV